MAQKRDQPVKITSASLEVRGKDKMATFSGDVHVVQGETDVRCNVLVVFYDGDGDKSGPGKATPGKSGPKSASGAGNQQIRRMEATGSVIVTQKDQKASASAPTSRVRANTLALIGNVVVTRGDDVLRGHRLFVDLTSGVSRMESGGGRVEGMFKSNSGQSPPQPPRARSE